MIPDRGRWAARELLVLGLPAAAGLAVIAAAWLAGSAGPAAFLGACLAAGATAAAAARSRLRGADETAGHLAALADADRDAAFRAMPPRALLGTRLARPLADVADRLRAGRAELAAGERMLDAVVEAVPDAMLLVDDGRTVFRANAAARRQFRIGRGDLPLARVLRDPGVLAAVSGALQSATASSVTFSPTLDRTKQFSARVEPLDLGSRGRGVLVALRERTEEVMIERMRSDFVANASHEIRNPLASIQGTIETLRGPARDDAAAREMFLEVMAGEAARMARLVDDLLSLSRVELAAAHPPTERCDLADVLGHAVDRMRPLAASSGVRIETSIPERLPPLLGDADQLHQLAANLVDNAVKYGGPGKAVTVRAEALPEAPADAGAVAGRPCVRVSVRDEGPGIAREHIPRLTERFYRVDTARSRRLRGTGLGLAIVKHILRRHQGHLLVESEIGKGSRFSVFLPTAPAGPGSVVTELSP